MKKIFMAILIGLLMVVAVATIAQADNGPHGKFNGSTEACASCHRAHSANSADGMLLVASDEYALCTSCHNGDGAITNVVDGYYDTNPGSPYKASLPTNQGDSGLGLFGGGFENTRMLTDYGTSPTATVTTNAGLDINPSLTAWSILNRYDANSTYPVQRPTTSNHEVAGGTGTVWGSGNFQTAVSTSPFGAQTGVHLECTSCHDPHGNAGRQGGLPSGAPVPSYRLLRFTPTGSNGWEVTGTNQVGAGSSFTWNTTLVPTTTGVLLPDTPIIWYTVNNDITKDPSLAAWRVRIASPQEIWVANFAGQGDYGGRYYGYKRPSAVVTSATTGSIISCGSLPTKPGTPCAAATGTAFNNQLQHDRLGNWCALCHDRYGALGGSSRTTDTGDPGYHYRHRSMTASATVGQYTCVDCHNAHGTSATASALSSSASYATGSVLLKADNRAICVRCHAGAINYFNVTTSPNAVMVVP